MSAHSDVLGERKEFEQLKDARPMCHSPQIPNDAGRDFAVAKLSSFASQPSRAVWGLQCLPSGLGAQNERRLL